MNPFKGKFAIGTIYTALLFILLFGNVSAIAQPIISGTQNVACQNEVVNYTLTNSFDTYQWTVTGGTPTSGTSSSINVTWGTGNRGQITVEGFNSGVSQGTATRRIYIDQPSSYTKSADTAFCNGGTATLGLTFQNKSLLFNGSTDYVGIANSGLINLGITDYRTVSLWFKANDITTRQVLYNEGGATNGFSMYIEGGNVYVLAWESNSAWNAPNAAINTGQWYNITFVFDEDATDGTHFKGYLNGVSIGAFNEGAKANNGMNAHSGPVAIGSNSNIRFHDNSTSANNYFNGRIDGFKLWNRSLEASEISLEQYHWLTAPVIDAALDVYINFDNSVLDIADNASAEDGAIYGTPTYDNDAPLIPNILWSPGGATTPTIVVNPTSTTNYSFTLTEKLSNYCNQTGNINVTVYPIPTITGTTPASRCGTGTVSLGATASAGTINWYAASTGGSSLGTGTSFTTPSISVTTSYWVDAINNGCTTASRTQVIATVNAIPTITGTTPASRCGTGTVSLGATASAGTINWYAASTGGSSLGTGTSYTTPSISVTTSYWVDATNNGCTTASRTEVIATINAIPTITGTTPASRCGTGTVSLGATASAGTINWYAASTGGSSLGTGTSFTTPSISVTTSYWVDATNNGCTTASRTQVIATVNAIPTITGTTPGSTCGTGTVVLGAAASAGTINWYAASTGGSSLGTGTSFTTPSISSTTTYWVDATANGCTTASRTSVVATISVGNVGVYATVGTAFGCYTTLKLAFDAINAGTHRGLITININGNTTETVAAVLNASGSGSASYSTISIRPTGGTARTITGSLATPLIDLNGADNVTINGLNTGGNSLTFTNTSTAATAGTSTIRFILDAENNIVQNCTIQGSATGAAVTGTIYFSTGIPATGVGNNNNTITNNTIAPAGANLPINAIYSLGTSAAIDNAGITISNNNIFDFFHATTTSTGVFVSTGNSTWTISNNKLYQTATRSTTGGTSIVYRAIQVTSGNGYIISGNSIGFANSSGTGTTTYTNAGGTTTPLYKGIDLALATGTVSSVQGNTIAGISFSTNSGAATAGGIFTGIYVTTGDVNIGTITGNTIGATTGTGSILISTTATTGYVAGILSSSTGTLSIQNNNIGSINLSGAALTAFTFHGINTTGAAGNYTISSNTIGSTTTANSISIVDGNTTAICSFNGITNAATGTIAITSNTIQNCSVNGTGASVYNGITNTGGTGTIDINNNAIRFGSNTGTGTMIAISAATAAPTTLNINNNTIRSHTRTTTTGAFTGISSTGAVSGRLNINNNMLGTANGGLVNFSDVSSGIVTGITVTTATSTCALSIMGNDIRGISYTSSGTGAHTYIINTAATLSQNISNNTFTNLDVNTTAAVTFISNSVVIPANGSQTVSGNSIVTGFNKGSAGGAVTLFTSTALTIASGITVTHQNNNFSNITLTGATTLVGWTHTDAGQSTKIFTGNTFNNWTIGSGAFTGLSVNGFGGTSSVSNNTVTNLNGPAAIVGITIGASGSATTLNLNNNIITGLTSTGVGGNVTGLLSSNLSSAVTISTNTINSFSSTGTTATVAAISVTAAVSLNLANNIISTLSASGITTPIINGISVASTGTVTIQNNTIQTISTNGAVTSGYTFNGILTSGATGSFTILNNLIGSTSVANSITIGAISTTTGVCIFNGIVNSATGTISITSNTIQNCTAYGTAASIFNGINNTGGTGTPVEINSNGIRIGTNTGTGATTIISNSAAASTLSINSNTIRSHVRNHATGNFAGISHITGVVTTAININNNQLGNANGDLITFGAVNSAGTVTGITVGAGGASAALSIQGNDIRGVTYTNNGITGAHTYISNTAATLSQNISNNTFTNLNVNTTGSINFITNSVIIPANGSQTVSGNNIVTGFNKGGAGGTVTFFTSTALTVASGVTVIHQNNNFSNVTLTGATAIAGWIHTDAGQSLKTFSNNIFDGWTTGSSAITQGMLINGGALGSSIYNNVFNNFNTTGAITGMISGVSGTYTIYNNTISNYTSGGIVIGYSIPTLANSITFRNNDIYSLSTTVGGTSTISGISSAGAITLNLDSNYIYGIQSTGVLTTTGTVRGISNTAGTTVSISTNTIANLQANSASTGILSGIIVSGGTNVTISKNVVDSLNANAQTSGTITGIAITGGTNIDILKNKIYDLYSNGAARTTGVIYGISIAGAVANATYNVQNNLIGNFYTPIVNSTTDIIRGIGVFATGTTTNINVYYNTVHLDATSTGTNFSVTGLFHTISTTATTARLDLRNNIINNFSTPKGSGLVVAFRRSAGTAGALANFASSSNNNMFFAGAPGANNLIYFDGTSNAQSLVQYKAGVFTAGTISPRDQASVSEDMVTNSTFLSVIGEDDEYLKINPLAVTLIESNATNIGGITDDYFGNIRQGNPGYIGTGTAPDIGANEVESYIITSLSGTYNVGVGQIFTSFTRAGAAFALVNNKGLSGNVIFNVTSDLSESGNVALNQWSETGAGNYTITIQSSAATTRLISGTVNNGLFRFNGADRVTIDGKVSGSGNYLTFRNTNTGTSAATFLFQTDAISNTITNCNIEGSGTSATMGTIMFTTGTVAGNDNIVITNNNIRPAGSNVPINAIYSVGSSSVIDNSNNTISNNNIQDYFSPTLASNGILIGANNSGWTISNNKIFQTATRTVTGGTSIVHRGIQITSGNGHTVSGNTIGYASSGGTGTMTYTRSGGTTTPLFRGIELTVGTVTASSVQGNLITNISISSNSAAALPGVFSGISVLAGNVNIGTTTGNTIGATTGNGAITITSTVTGGVITGIYSTSTGTVQIQNNNIGSISTGSANTIGHVFNGIYTVGAAGNYTIFGNLIGSLTTPNSISIGTDGVTTTGVCTFNGINNVATGTSSITNNTIQNCSVYGTGASVFSGIINTGGIGTAVNINNNSIRLGTNESTGGLTVISNTVAAASVNINNNIIRSFNRTLATGGFIGISCTGAVTSAVNINNNQFGNSNGGLIEYDIANSSTLTGITVTTATNTCALSIQGNDFRGIDYLVSGSGAHTYISNTAATLSQNISNNTFTNLNVNTTGSVTFINNSVVIPANGSQTVSGNNIVTGFYKGGAGGTVTLFNSTAATVASGITVTHQNNNFSGIELIGATTMAGWLHTDAGSSVKTFSGNTFTNWTCGSSATTVLNINGGAVGSAISNNTISNIFDAGTVTGLICGGSGTYNIHGNNIHTLSTTGGTTTTLSGISGTGTTTLNVYENTIYGLQGNSITTGSINGIIISGGTNVNVYQNTVYNIQGNAITTGTISGIWNSGGTTVTVYRNKIYDLSSDNISITSGGVVGIQVSGAVASAVYTLRNNIIGDLRTPNVSSTSDAIRGISLISTGVTSNLNVFYNTIQLNATSTGTNFTSFGIYHVASATATTAALDMRNNIISNSSVPNGSGVAIAFRRSTTNLNNYSASSNNNLFYAGIPGSNNLIFSDGTNNDQTLGDFQARMITRDALSVTEDLITELKYLSLSGSSANFLHMDPSKGNSVDNGAVNIAGITIDFDGQIRQGNAGYTGNGTAPDIGADEFEGLCVNLIWTGTFNTDWNNASNWNCHLPNVYTNITIPTGLSNYPLLNTGLAGVVKNIIIQSGGTLTVTNNSLKIYGSISNSGTFTALSATIEMNGLSAQTIPIATFAGNNVKNLTINNTAGVTVNGDINLFNILTLAANTTLTLGTGNIILKSDTTNTARIAPVPATATIAYGTGRFISERYILGRRKYRLMTSPVTTSPNATLTGGEEGLSIWGNWQNQGNNSTPNVGTFITGGSLVNGYDQQTTNASLFTYNASARLFEGFTTANGKNTKYTPLKAGIPYYMFVYGDRTNSAITSNPNVTVLKATGKILTGDQIYNTGSSLPLSNTIGEYTMIGNPFASPIDWGTVTRTNIADTYWGWDPNLSSTGGYVTINTVGSVTLISPYSGSVGLDQYIQSGQGFFVKTNGASPVLTIKESDKVGNYNNIAFRTESNNIPLIAVNLFYTDPSGTKLMDGALTAFDSSFSNTVGKEDASKILKAGEGLSMECQSELLSINARKMPENKDTLLLNLTGLTKTQYTLQIFAKEMTNSTLEPYLEDRYLNTKRLLSLTDTNNIAFLVNTAVPSSFDKNRFRIVFLQSGGLSDIVTAIAATKENRKVKVQWNVSGEQGVQQYEVQRTGSSNGFTKIGEMTARGSATATSYQWFDENPFTGVNHYRIRIIYQDGSVKISPVATINLNEEKPVMTVFPNPVEQYQINIRFTNLVKGKYTARLFDAKGQLLMEKIIEYDGGLASQTIPISRQIIAGMYFLQITDGKEKLNQTLFIK